MGTFKTLVVGSLAGVSAVAAYKYMNDPEFRQTVVDTLNKAADDLNAKAEEIRRKGEGYVAAAGFAPAPAAAGAADGDGVAQAQRTYVTVDNARRIITDTAAKVVAKAEEVADNAKEAIAGGAEAFGSDDELRDKINEARERIAAQVAANVAASQEEAASSDSAGIADEAAPAKAADEGADQV